jgi:phage gp36-like protein
VAQYASSAQFGVYGLPAAALDGFTGSVDDHLTAASAVVDSYARGRYKVPLTLPAPLEIVSAVCALAAYSIVNVRGFDPHSGADANLRTRYEDLMGTPLSQRGGQKGWLQQLAAGLVNLDVSADATLAHDGAPIVASRAARSSSSGACCDDARGGRFDFWGNGGCW